MTKSELESGVTRRYRFMWELIIPVLEKLMNDPPPTPTVPNADEIARIQSRWRTAK